jgi:hypothetical protein
MRFGMFIRRHGRLKGKELVFLLDKVSRITIMVGDLIITAYKESEDEFICKTEKNDHAYKCIQIFKDMEMRLDPFDNDFILSMGSNRTGENVCVYLTKIKKILIETQFNVCDSIDNMDKIKEEVRKVWMVKLK